MGKKKVCLASAGQWQKPYDILIKEGIRKCQKCRENKSNHDGASRKDIFNYIRSKYHNMKYLSTQQGLARALRRMTRSGHVAQKKSGYFHLTKKGQKLQWEYGKKFDRTICGQKALYHEMQSRRKKNRLRGICHKSKLKAKRKRVFRQPCRLRKVPNRHITFGIIPNDRVAPFRMCSKAMMDKTNPNLKVIKRTRRRLHDRHIKKNLHVVRKIKNKSKFSKKRVCRKIKRKHHHINK